MYLKKYKHLWIALLFLSAINLSSCDTLSLIDISKDADAFERANADGPSLSLTINGENSSLPNSFSPHSNNNFISATDLNQISKGGIASFSFSLNASLHEVTYENGEKENDIDIYRFYVTFPGTFEFSLTSNNFPYYVSLYCSTSSLQKGKTILLEGDLTQLDHYRIQYPGAYYLEVKSKGTIDASSSYSLEASYQADEEITTSTYFEEGASAMLWKASYIPEGVYPFFEELKGSAKLLEEDAYAKEIASYQKRIEENAGDSYSCIPLYTITLERGSVSSFLFSTLYYAIDDLNFLYDGENIRKYDDSVAENKLFSIEEEAKKVGIKNVAFIKSFLDIILYEELDMRDEYNTNEEVQYFTYLTLLFQGLDTINREDSSRRYYSLPLVGEWLEDGTFHWDNGRLYPIVGFDELYLDANESLPSLPFSAPGSGTYYAIKGSSNLKAYLA